MNSWALLLCEGAHDQEFLCCLAQAASGWQHVKKMPDGVPKNLGGSQTLFYLVRQAQTLVLANLNGVNKILGDAEKLIVDQAKTASVVGVMLDANGEGVVVRRDAVRSHFGAVMPSAQYAEHATIVSAQDSVDDQRRFGLWIAPNGTSSGSLDEVIRQAADLKHPGLTRIADQFVKDLGVAAEHRWERYFQKAVLGALGQLWKAGNSLASALQERDRWMDSTLVHEKPFADIVRFMERLLE